MMRSIRARLYTFLGIAPPTKAMLSSRLRREMARLDRLEEHIADLQLVRDRLEARCEELNEQLESLP